MMRGTNYHSVNRLLVEKNDSYTAKTLEETISDMIYNKEPINETAPLIYTARADGVRPEYNIRTDKFDQALELTEKTALSRRERRMEFLKGQATGNVETTANSPDTQ